MIVRNSLATICLMVVTSCSPIISCERYASDFPCYYVTDLATYDVFYWKNVYADNPADERIIGTAKGLRACKTMAQGYAAMLEEEWNDRAYICALVDDGGYAEKHRFLD